MNKKIKYIFNICIIFIVLLLVLYFSLKDNFNQIIDYILKMDYRYFLLGIILFLLYRTIIGITEYKLVYLNKEKISLKKMLGINYIIPFFHGVTPFASGGQPMEVYYLHKEGIDVSVGTNIVLQNFILSQTALVLLGLFSVIYNLIFQIFPANSLIRKLVTLGFIVNALVLVVSCLFSFSKRMSKFISNTLIDFLYKIKLIKHKDKTRKKITDYLENFYKNTKTLSQNKLLIVRLIFLNIIGLILLYSIAIVISYGLGERNINYISSIIAVAYTMIIGSFVPIPGGTGGVEYGFVTFFGYLVKGNIVTAVMLLWRFITYYFAMIFGAIYLIFYRKKELK